MARQDLFPNDIPDDFIDLIHVWFEGTPTPEDVARFRQRLDDPLFRKEVGHYAITSGHLRDQGGYLRDDKAVSGTGTAANVPDACVSTLLNARDVTELYELLERNRTKTKSDPVLRRLRFHMVATLLLLLVSVVTLGVIVFSLTGDRDAGGRVVETAETIAVSYPEIADATDGTGPLDQEAETASRSPSNSKQEPPVVATMRNIVDVEWVGMNPVQHGEMLRAGRLAINKGLLVIDFLSGVRVIVRGPAELELNNTHEIFVSHGNLSCQVTEFGRGFKIRTPQMDVIDLGTSFGLDIVPNRKPEIHVLEGKVLVQTTKEKKAVEIEENQAFRWEGDSLGEVVFDPDRFVNLDEVQSLDRFSVEKKTHLWNDKTETFHREGHVLVHYSGQDVDLKRNLLINRAKANKLANDGVLIGCSRGLNRWGNGDAVEFRTPIDRVLFKVQGQYDTLTFLTWVRIDALTNDCTALVTCEEQRIWEANLPEKYRSKAKFEPPYLRGIRWEIAKTGQIHFNICHGGKVFDPGLFEWDIYGTGEPVIRQEEFGQWLFLAVTYDRPSASVALFVNGKCIARHKVSRPVTLPLEYLNIGNCDVPFAKVQYRLLGSVDELLILNRALPTEEIAEIHQVGSR